MLDAQGVVVLMGHCSAADFSRGTSFKLFDTYRMLLVQGRLEVRFGIAQIDQITMPIKSAPQSMKHGPFQRKKKISKYNRNVQSKIL